MYAIVKIYSYSIIKTINQPNELYGKYLKKKDSIIANHPSSGPHWPYLFNYENSYLGVIDSSPNLQKAKDQL